MPNMSGIVAAYEEARKGYEEGGIPIGSVILDANGEILGRGHNQRIQRSSPTLHAEIAALENAGRQRADVYRTATLVGVNLHVLGRFTRLIFDSNTQYTTLR
jgi:cytosine deaminase